VRVGVYHTKASSGIMEGVKNTQSLFMKEIQSLGFCWTWALEHWRSSEMEWTLGWPSLA